MRTTCLINSYNYSKYVVAAIDSALRQTVPFDEIIIVDDGSTDESVNKIREQYGANEKIRLITKENQGQLSCFVEGFLASTGDIIFFLDADDMYTETYLEKALRFYADNMECDFLFCGLREFGQSDKVILRYNKNRDLGYSIFNTLYRRKWLGAPTSAISLRRSILSKILPIPQEYYEDWRVRADDCLVWGASLFGGRKYYLAEPLLLYRVHGENNWCGKKCNYVYEFERIMKINRLFSYFLPDFDPYQRDYYKLVKKEFNTIAQPKFTECREYMSIVLSAKNLLFTKRLQIIISLLQIYISRKLQI